MCITHTPHAGCAATAALRVAFLVVSEGGAGAELEAGDGVGQLALAAGEELVPPPGADERFNRFGGEWFTAQFAAAPLDRQVGPEREGNTPG